MTKRQRVLLGFIARAPGAVHRTHLMKWLFLLREEAPAAAGDGFYEFVPYKFGPFSFQAYRDMEGLEADGLLAPDEPRIPAAARADADAAVAELDASVADGMATILARYGEIPRDRLLDDVYARYPWYASRSELRPSVPAPVAPLAVYTVGYQGRTVDGLLDLLLRAGVRGVLDVRSNPVSRKYGFGGRTLARLCADVGLVYAHLPSLGVPSALRGDLTSRAAYDTLFDHYEREILPGQGAALDQAASLMRERPMALLCFEADPSECHRGRLAPHVAARSDLEVRAL